MYGVGKCGCHAWGTRLLFRENFSFNSKYLKIFAVTAEFFQKKKRDRKTRLLYLSYSYQVYHKRLKMSDYFAVSQQFYNIYKDIANL